MVKWIAAGREIYRKYKEDEMTVYAAQVSFFVLLSFVPFIMLLLTAVQMIPAISQAEFMELVVAFTPEDYKSLAFRMVNDLSLKSPATMVSLTAVTALWSAGRGDVQHGKRAGPRMGKGGEILVHYQPADLLRLHHCFCGCVHPFSDPSGVWPASSGVFEHTFSLCGSRDRPADRFQIPVVFSGSVFLFLGDLYLCAGKALKGGKADSGSALFRFGMDGFFSGLFHLL